MSFIQQHLSCGALVWSDSLTNKTIVSRLFSTAQAVSFYPLGGKGGRPRRANPLEVSSAIGGGGDLGHAHDQEGHPARVMNRSLKEVRLCPLLGRGHGPAHSITPRSQVVLVLLNASQENLGVVIEDNTHRCGVLPDRTVELADGELRVLGHQQSPTNTQTAEDMAHDADRLEVKVVEAVVIIEVDAAATGSRTDVVGTEFLNEVSQDGQGLDVVDGGREHWYLLECGGEWFPRQDKDYRS